MRYYGGKSGYANKIVKAIMAENPDMTAVVEPFCGSLSVSEMFAYNDVTVYASDFNYALIQTYQSTFDGWFPPTSITKEQWTASKHVPDTNPMKGFCGAFCSYGGYWFKRYDPKGAYSASVHLRALCAIKDKIQLFKRHYATIENTCGIWYCDPPYWKSEDGYGCGEFDHGMFWGWAERMANEGNTIYISAYLKPRIHNVVKVAEFPLKRSFSGKVSIMYDGLWRVG